MNAMKKFLTVLMVLSVLSMTGCANGPIRNFFRGAACYWCGTGPKTQTVNYQPSPCTSCNTGGSNVTSFSPNYDLNPGMPGGIPSAESLPSPVN